MTEQMAKLPAAAASPRIAGGVLKWYAGDTFQLQIQMALQDQNGRPVEIRAGQTVELVFRDHRDRELLRVCFDDVTDNCVTFVLDEVTGARFPAGNYTYDVIYSGFSRKTLVHRGPILVE